MVNHLYTIKNWTVAPEMAPTQSDENCLPGSYTKNSFLASRFTSTSTTTLSGPLNMISSVSPAGCAHKLTNGHDVADFLNHFSWF